MRVSPVMLGVRNSDVSARLLRLRAGLSECCNVSKVLGKIPSNSVSPEHTLRSLRLTVQSSRKILCSMPPRLALTLFVAVLTLMVCSSSVWLIPAGQGPFSAAYGPISIFQAQRAAARLVSCIRSTLPATLVAAAIGSYFSSRLDFAAAPGPAIPDPPSSICILQC